MTVSARRTRTPRSSLCPPPITPLQRRSWPLGVNIVIYANQLTRSAFPAMQRTAEDILRFHRAKEVDERLLPIREIITLIDEL